MNQKKARKMTVEEAEKIYGYFCIQCTPEEAKAFLVGHVLNERVQDAMWAQMKLRENEYCKNLSKELNNMPTVYSLLSKSKK